MSRLEDLKLALTIEDLAKLLGFKASAISFILYKIPAENKYTPFSIPKKHGGVREILAPIPQLKLLQRHLGELLYDCRDEIEKNRQRRPLSHGFRRRLSIYTNASVHKNKRHVLNVDIKDFFPSINFGRVRGLFISNKDFQLNPRIATLIAQIATHENQLPQGSPSSPIIADLIAEIMDVRIAKLTKKYGLKYSRYADDLSFSTNAKVFPLQVFEPLANGVHAIGANLRRVTIDSGFVPNDEKTRIQFRGSRQSVTGLVVNKKVNVDRTYYKTIRAMCYSFFTTGS